MLLRRTRRTVAERLYLDLISAYPTLESLAQADPHELRELVAWAGLGKVRASQLSRLSAEITQNRGEIFPVNAQPFSSCLVLDLT
ncbi:hypothetical protein [Calidithermus timidus]|uniref:hypothetical protein n=1 Tax=Calidithermus timidus TaxID=307124 RepID=UPI0009854B7F